MARNDIKYWLKMKILAPTDSWVMRCTHIGQVKLFGYILSTYNTNDGTWSYDKYKEALIVNKLDITKATIFTYLKKLVEAEILIKRGKGIYEINDKFIEYGSRK